MIDIAELAHETVVLEEGGPSVRPRWIMPRGRPMTQASRNPLLAWETMPHVQVRSWRVRNVVLDATTMLLLHEGRIIRETQYHRSAAELAALRVEPARLLPIKTDLPVLLCGDAWATNHYHFLNHTLPTIDAGVARHGAAGVCLAMPLLRSAHENLLRLLGHDWAGTVRLEPGRQYAIRDAEFCAFAVGVADFANSRCVQALHDRLSACVPDGGKVGPKLYVSRQRDTHRRGAGEPELIEGLRRRGFAIVMPADMPIEAQIAAFRGADLVVAPHGAGLANIAFCRPGTAVYEFLPAHFVDSSILNLAIRAGLRPWVDAFETDTSDGSHTSDWTLDVPAILARVDEITKPARWWQRH